MRFAVVLEREVAGLARLRAADRGHGDAMAPLLGVLGRSAPRLFVDRIELRAPIVADAFVDEREHAFAVAPVFGHDADEITGWNGKVLIERVMGRSI